jgi:hypothetical protein
MMKIRVHKSVEDKELIELGFTIASETNNVFNVEKPIGWGVIVYSPNGTGVDENGKPQIFDKPIGWGDLSKSHLKMIIDRNSIPRVIIAETYSTLATRYAVDTIKFVIVGNEKFRFNPKLNKTHDGEMVIVIDTQYNTIIHDVGIVCDDNKAMLIVAAHTWLDSMYPAWYESSMYWEDRKGSVAVVDESFKHPEHTFRMVVETEKQLSSVKRKILDGKHVYMVCENKNFIANLIAWCNEYNVEYTETTGV